jgi:hypothetical protein
VRNLAPQIIDFYILERGHRYRNPSIPISISVGFGASALQTSDRNSVSNKLRRITYPLYRVIDD